MRHYLREDGLTDHLTSSFPTMDYSEQIPNGASPAVLPVAAKPASSARSSRVRRWLKRFVALTLIATTLLWLVLPLVCPISNQAVVNARLIQVRAPIDGTTHDLSVELGQPVNSGSSLVTLKNQQLDSIHLPGLQIRQAELQARRVRIASELAGTESAEKLCRIEAEKYRVGRISVLQASLKERSAQIDVANANLSLRKKGLERVQKGKVAIPLQELDSANENEFTARKQIEICTASLEKIQEELKGAKEGIYLYQEAPNCLQRADELAMKLPQLRSNLIETEEMLVSLAKEIEREQSRMKQLAEATVTAPTSGVIWTQRANAGQVVKQNETLFEVADAKSVFVEALINQRHLPTVNPGSRATIILTGGKTLAGRVRSVRTPGPDDAESSFAIKLGKQDLKQVRVLIDFPAGEADVALIGRHVRVMISDEEPGAVQRTLVWLFTNWGG